VNEAEFKARTKKIAIELARAATELPAGRVPDVYARQLIRSGSSIGANYRASCRARADAEMVAKLGIVEEEADESQYWIELLLEGGFITVNRAQPLLEELNQIIAMVVASRRTIKARIERTGNRQR